MSPVLVVRRCSRWLIPPRTSNSPGELEKKAYFSKNPRSSSLGQVLKPNCNFNQATEDIIELTKNYTKNDHVIIIGGTNNCHCDLHSYYKHGFDCEMNRLKYVKKKTNVNVFEVPNRYDCNKCNINVQKFNTHLKKQCEINSISNISLINKLNRNDVTNHGLHLNKFGKKKIAMIIKDTVSNKPKNVPNAVDNFLFVKNLLKKLT